MCNKLFKDLTFFCVLHVYRSIVHLLFQVVKITIRPFKIFYFAQFTMKIAHVSQFTQFYQKHEQIDNLKTENIW